MEEQKPTDLKQREIADVVCPMCFKLLPYPSVVDEGVDRYHGRLRTYYGWCPVCERGACVIQFARDGRWVIHKYRKAILLDGAGEVRLVDDWVVLNELPEVAPVMLGPGGDYNRPFTPEVVGLFGKLKSALQGCVDVVEQLMKVHK